MADVFKLRKLTNDDRSPSAVPLVLQSDYKWKDNAVVTAAASATELQLVPEALEMLRKIDRPVAVLAICGPYRSGKSFFISRVLGQPGTFKVGDGTETCTRGIWLSTSALECDRFVLLLLDTEGIGAVEEEKSEYLTTKLLVTTILLSSFLIYNSMEVPKQSDLQQMRCVFKVFIACSTIPSNISISPVTLY